MTVEAASFRGEVSDSYSAIPPQNAIPVLLVASEAPLDARALTAGELTQVAALSGASRGALWLTARRALRLALAGTGRPTDTSAYGFPSPVASLSHSADLAVAAVLAADYDGVVGVGVDIELDRVPDPRTASFFLTESELGWLESVPTDEVPAVLTRLWTVKEALFKADPVNAETTLRDYQVADPAAMRGRATRSGEIDFQYVSLARPRGVLSVAVALSQSSLSLSWLSQSWKVDPVQTVDFDLMASRISSLISVPIERLAPDATIAELVPDSFMFIEVAVDLQEEFDVILSQHDLKDVHTLGDLAALLQSRQVEQANV
jgi:phosphopantetheinyl transferase/acyl carrier protein